MDDCTGGAVAEDLIVFEPLFSNGIGAVINMEISLAIGPDGHPAVRPTARFLVIEGAPDEQIFIWSYGGGGTLTTREFSLGSSLEGSALVDGGGSR